MRGAGDEAAKAHAPPSLALPRTLCMEPSVIGLKSVMMRFVFLYISFSFTLYLTYRRVGRGNIVLRQVVGHFLPSFRRFEFELLLERGDENIK